MAEAPPPSSPIGVDEQPAASEAPPAETGWLRRELAQAQLEKNAEEARRIAGLIQSVDGGSAPPWLTERLRPLLAHPSVAAALSWAWVIFVHNIFPLGQKLWYHFINFYNYSELDLLTCAYGLSIAFFGGNFAITISAIEAWKLSGWDTTWVCLLQLKQNYERALEAHRKDNEEDLDGDGIADVDQINRKQLVARKAALLAKSIDPEQCSLAIYGIWQAWLGVLTTLKFQYAKTVALGASVGNMLKEPVSKFVVPLLMDLVPSEHQKWIPLIVRYSCKTVAISVIWVLATWQSALQSAFKGGFIFATAAVDYLVRKQKLTCQQADELHARDILAFTIATTGMLWQFSNGFSLPFPINIVLFPLRVVEYFIRWSVSEFEVPATAYSGQ